MASSQKPGIAFLVIGVVFIAVGASGPHALLAVGVVFMAVGAALTARARKASGTE